MRMRAGRFYRDRVHSVQIGIQLSLGCASEFVIL